MAETHTSGDSVGESTIDNDFELVNSADAEEMSPQAEPTMDVAVESTESPPPPPYDGGDHSTQSTNGVRTNTDLSDGPVKTSGKDKAVETRSERVAAAATPAPRDLGVFSGLSPQYKSLVLHENPTHSASVVALAITMYVLLTVNFGLSLIFIVAVVAKVITGVALVSTVAKSLYDKHVQGQPEYTSIARVTLEPILEKISAEASPYTPSSEQVHAVLESVVMATPTMATEARDVLYCTSWKKTAKALLVLHVACKVGKVFSLPGLMLTAILFMFSVPFAYNSKKADVDHAYDVAVDKMSETIDTIVSSLPASVTSKFKSD